jgi:hypothetical protein
LVVDIEDIVAHRGAEVSRARDAGGHFFNADG